MSLVGSFKHLPDSRHTQITAYFCMQLACKYSSLVSCIIPGSFQPTSLSFRMLKMCKIQRENILNRPISILQGEQKLLCLVRMEKPGEERLFIVGCGYSNVKFEYYLISAEASTRYKLT